MVTFCEGVGFGAAETVSLVAFFAAGKVSVAASGTGVLWGAVEFSASPSLASASSDGRSPANINIVAIAETPATAKNVFLNPIRSARTPRSNAKRDWRRHSGRRRFGQLQSGQHFITQRAVQRRVAS